MTINMTCKKKQIQLIIAVTIGNILEWYEIYLYIYWAPIISRLFFNATSDLGNTINVFTVFAIGFMARPLGGLFFGRLGDKIGRKKTLILSVLLMSFPTFVIGLLPTYAQIGSSSIILLTLLRFLQSFPAGGEQSGAFCFLYESAELEKRRFMTSWGAVGTQIGIILSMTECLLLEKFLSPEDLLNWGWRLSFLLGGCIGLFGFYLRTKLHETPSYNQLKYQHQITKKNLGQVLKKYQKSIGLAIMICAYDAVAFYLLSTLLPIFVQKKLAWHYNYGLLLTIALMLLITIPLPFIGKLADRYNNKKILLSSMIGSMLIFYPIYHTLQANILVPLFFCIGIFILCYCCITALIPYLLANLFPTKVRYTCVGISFSIADGIIGGISPLIFLSLLGFTYNVVMYFLLMFFSALLSLIAFGLFQERHPAHTTPEVD